MKPMLAHNWDKHSKKIKYPCYTQPKLDGMRCLARREGDTIRLCSRALKDIKNLEHIRIALIDIMKDGETFDGELYVHGYSFQTLISWIKRDQEDSKKVQYHVYDKISDKIYTERSHELRKALMDHDGPIRNVVQYLCCDADEIDLDHVTHKKAGYEGTIIRNANSLYKQGRSFDLLKRKDFYDSEFEIEDVLEGKGKFKGCAVFICGCNGYVFACTSPGSISDKRHYFENQEQYIGRKLTVKYQEKTAAGIPRFPIAITVRDYE